MFLAFKEIKREKMRYGLIVLMIFLISYLILVLSSLAIGLASENTQAIDSWQIKKVILNKNSNISMAQSFLTKDDLAKKKLTDNEAYIGQTPVVVKKNNHKTVSAQYLGIKQNQFIYQKQSLISGRKAQKDDEVTADIALKQKGYHLGNKIKLNDSKTQYKIVGFVRNAKINIAPIVYGNLKTWKKLRAGMNNIEASAIVSKNSKFSLNHKNAKTYSVNTFIKKLPGYNAQNVTFEMMIGFLFVISLIIIAVFLYILTMQKMRNFAVMRAQGIPAKTLVMATISQAMILMILGIMIALIGMWLTLMGLPKVVPFEFSWQIGIFASVGMLVMGLIGSLIPVRSILKVDPAQAIGA